MRVAFLALASLLLLAALGAIGLRWTDDLSGERVWRDLAALAGRAPGTFDPAMVDGLPEPAQRFFLKALTPGAPLSRQVELEIEGALRLGGAEAAPMAMTARQILAPPYGFDWRLKTDAAIGGTDALWPGGSWSRFRLWGVVPVARGGGDADHRRSAFGRMVGEAVMWTPAALLPATEAGWSSLAWRGVDADTAEVVVSFGGLEQAVRITVAEDGTLERLVFDRWSNENPDKVFRAQPFGAEISGWGEFNGIRVPTALVGGNNFGTALYDRFYTVTTLRATFR